MRLISEKLTDYYSIFFFSSRVVSLDDILLNYFGANPATEVHLCVVMHAFRL